jgi:ketosteroid isomerase-like protein
MENRENTNGRFAGDGTILGGWKEWYDKLDWYDQDTVKWNHWQFRNIHVMPLASDVAGVTLEFENSRTTKAGNTERVKGAWTHLFQKQNGKWRVVLTNGAPRPVLTRCKHQDLRISRPWLALPLEGHSRTEGGADDAMGDHRPRDRRDRY